MTREGLPGLLKIAAEHAHPVLNFSSLGLLDEGYGEVFEALIKDVVAEDMRHRSDTKVFLLRYPVHLSLGSHLCQLRRCRFADGKTSRGLISGKWMSANRPEH